MRFQNVVVGVINANGLAGIACKEALRLKYSENLKSSWPVPMLPDIKHFQIVSSKPPGCAGQWAPFHSAGCKSDSIRTVFVAAKASGTCPSPPSTKMRPAHWSYAKCLQRPTRPGKSIASRAGTIPHTGDPRFPAPPAKLSSCIRFGARDGGGIRSESLSGRAKPRTQFR